jgi:exopolyphosphatase/guanosine-5'-triphosphate,3'-diphosphate pyrophosphatase
MLAEQDARTSAHQQFERDRWESVLATCKRYGVDPRLAEPVRAHAAQLFRDLQPVHGLPPEYCQWLEAAAMMRDVGKYINYQGHHRHTQYVIAGSEFYGFTPQQRAIVSGIARYLGKSRPAPQDRAFRYIAVSEHDNVKRAIVLLRLAVALNQDRASDVLRVTVRAYPKRVSIEIQLGRNSSYGRCARRQTTSARSSAVSSSQCSPESGAACVYRPAPATDRAGGLRQYVPLRLYAAAGSPIHHVRRSGRRQTA